MSTVFLGTYQINDKSEGCEIHTSLTSYPLDDLPFYADKNHNDLTLVHQTL